MNYRCGGFAELLKTGGIRGYDCFEAVDLEVCLRWMILWDAIGWKVIESCNIDCVSVYLDIVW